MLTKKKASVGMLLAVSCVAVIAAVIGTNSASGLQYYDYCGKDFKPCPAKVLPLVGTCVKGETNPTILACCIRTTAPDACNAAGGAAYDCGKIVQCATATYDAAGNVIGCELCGILPNSSFGSGNGCTS